MLSLPFSQLDKPEVPLLDYEVAEITWENGQVAMNGFGLPRLKMKPVSSNTLAKYTWEMPRASGTLESVVNEAAYAPPHYYKEPFSSGAGNEDLVPWFGQHWSGSTSETLTMDALVPCSKRSESPAPPLMDTSLVGCSIDRVGSSSVAKTKEGSVILPLKWARVARVHSPPDWSSRNLSASSSAPFEKDGQYISYDTYDGDLGVAFTSTSPSNTSSGKPCTKSASFDDHDSVCYSKPQGKRDASEGDDEKKGNGKASVSNKRSRVAAIHNQSERKRRYKINQKMKTLEKLVPSSSKTDKASMLDEVIEYLKQLQAQVQMMMRMNMPPMMLPPPMQQLQMSMLQATMGLGPMIGTMGLGLGMGMDMNSMSRSNVSGVPPVLHPGAFMFVNPWDGSADRVQPASAPLIPNPVSSFLSCQSQPINVDAYCRLAAMYQQIHQQTISSSKN